MTHHGQTGNTTTKLCILLQRGRIVGQFLHWNFEGKNPHFSAIGHQRLAKNSIFYCWWQNTLIFGYFWEMTCHGLASNTTTAYFLIPSQRRSIAGQFLHWSFEGKNSQFFATDRQKLAKSVCLGTDDKSQPFLSLGKWHATVNTTAKFRIPSKRRRIASQFLCWNNIQSVSYTHLTLPTKRIV